MSLRIDKNQNKLYWTFQFAGWTGYSILGILIFLKGNEFNPTVIAGLTLTNISGFIITIPARYLYRAIIGSKIPIFKQVVIIGCSIVLFVVVWFSVDVFLSIPLNGLDWAKNIFTFQKFVMEFFWYLFPLTLWSALYFMIKLWLDSEIKNQKLEQAEALAKEAQLLMLQYQLNPHFLFNSLNSIRALIDENKKNAQEMITELARFLQYSLKQKNATNVPLKDELRAIRHYLLIEKIRFEEKLQVNYAIQPLAEEYPVLSFLLLPLVENAVKHGMKNSSLPLKIRITARVEKDILMLEVRNSGTWITPVSPNSDGTGTGLANIKSRLENAFPGNYDFKITRGASETSVQIHVFQALELKTNATA
ncbi:MAG: hypothetical protein DWQ05_21940 [Calditrichaeota bacterium]|nr:MAG: hypothetical protein DWQ05_21940 [Calditrichota bacterium]